jgi:V/A-type H+-transporting ATPase subunit E
MSKLNDILEQEALTEINQILEASDATAVNLIQEAEDKAAARLAIQRKRMESATRTARHRAEGAAELAVSTARIQAKGEIIARVRKKVLIAIEELARKPGYSTILTALADEAIRTLDAAEILFVNPKDAAILADWAKQKRIEIRTDPDLHFGVRVASSRKRSVENSLPERLDRSWDMLSARVARVLWAEG